MYDEATKYPEKLTIVESSCLVSTAALPTAAGGAGATSAAVRLQLQRYSAHAAQLHTGLCWQPLICHIM